MRANRLLGYPDDARLLIINADDFGMCGAVNVRQTDYDFLVSSDARDIIRRERIVLLSYRPIQAVWEASH